MEGIREMEIECEEKQGVGRWGSEGRIWSKSGGGD